MRQLRDDTHLILDGEVRVYRRERSKRWQAPFVIERHTIRISTGSSDQAIARQAQAAARPCMDGHMTYIYHLLGANYEHLASVTFEPGRR